MTSTTQDNSKIRLCLSRRIYTTESSVIGCVIVPPELEHQISSLNIYVAGRGRLDSRWHDTQSVKKYYGTHPCHDVIPDWVERLVEESYFLNSARAKKSNSTPKSGTLRNDMESICFWSTNVLTLYNEQGLKVPWVVGGHPSTDVNDSAPLVMSGSDWFRRASRFLEILHGNEESRGDSLYQEEEEDSSSSLDDDSSNSDSSDPSSSRTNCSHDDTTATHDQVENSSAAGGKYFTFRSDLPADIYPTVNATSVRYYYSVVVYASRLDGQVSFMNV